MRRRRVRGAAVVVAILLPLAGCGQLFGPKATLGPGAIVRGRGLYNDVISETNNEQTLELIVRARYGEPAAMMSVASVTAGLHAGTTTEAQFGFGAPSNYKGNIVPLSVGVAYEENPTISYVPVQGERYAKSLLTPIGLDVLLLLLGIENGPAQSISMLVKHVNGLDNATYGPPEKRAAFRASVALLSSLQDDGLASVDRESDRVRRLRARDPRLRARASRRGARPTPRPGTSPTIPCAAIATSCCQ